MTRPEATPAASCEGRGSQADSLLRALLAAFAAAAGAPDAWLLLPADDDRVEATSASGMRIVLDCHGTGPGEGTEVSADARSTAAGVALAARIGKPAGSLVALPIVGEGIDALAAIQIDGELEPGMASARRAMGLLGASLADALSLRDAVAKLRDAAAHHDRMLRNMTEGAVVLGEFGEIAYLNEAASAMLGLSPDAAIGRSITRVLGDLNGWLLEAIDQIATRQETLSLEDIEVYLDHDDRWTAFNLCLLPLSGTRGQLNGMMLLLQSLDREKALHQTLSRYVSPSMADHLLEARDSTSEGHLAEVTILFSDIRDFTAISETIGAAETVLMLNDYFSFIEDVVANHGGIVDKYIGDAVMTVFGIPKAGASDAINAVNAALDMVRALAILNARRVADGKSMIRTGIGLATGKVMAGNIGSARRMDFTVIGDAVNLASRIEGMTKPYGADILMDGETAARIVASGVSMRRLDRVRVKGQETPTDIYQADTGVGRTSTDADEWKTTYELGLRSYLDGHWSAAKRVFDGMVLNDPRDGTARMMASRCAEMDRHPAIGWDGVTKLDRK